MVPEDYISLTHMGRSLYYIEELKESIISLDKAIKLNPRYAAAYAYRGRTLTRQERYQKAQKDLDTAIKEDPYHVNAYTFRGELYEELGEYKKAENDYKKSLQLHPGSTHVNEALQRVRDKQKNQEK